MTKYNHGIVHIDSGIQNPVNIEQCPLCGNKQYYNLNTYEINDLIAKWKKEKGMAPIAACYKDKILERRECTICNLQYYNYRLPDVARFYEVLCQKIAIYHKEKWEYDEALKIVKKYKPQSILDIGCGNGNFIEKIVNSAPIVMGCEFNPIAIENCKKKGLNVTNNDLKNIDQKFDMIVSFQVLEHVKEPNKFISDCINLLNDNGLLFFATPNPDCSLIKYNSGILELPPHHCMDITKDCYEYIAKAYNLELINYERGEVAFWIYKIYLEAKFKSYSKYLKQIDNIATYENYLKEKDEVISKDHCVLYRKTN